MPSDKAMVGILMSTYNGGRYLREQMDSILNQKDVDILLFVRDDGSSDDTLRILGEYAAKDARVILCDLEGPKHLGVRDSFLSLLRMAVTGWQDIAYFSFADQDDVWLEDKISAAIHLLAKTPSDRGPALYYSNKTFVDRELNMISEEHIKYYGDFYETFYSAYSSGCTQVFNRALAEYAIREVSFREKWIHDAWVYRLAKVCGAYIAFDPVSHIYYRQHGDNVCGMEACRAPHVSVKNMFHNAHHQIQNMMRDLCDAAQDAIAPEARRYIDWVLSYNHKPSAALHLALDRQAFRRGPKLYIAWIVKLLVHRL